MDLKSGIDKFGLNPEDINDLYDEDKAAATGDAPVAAAAVSYTHLTLPTIYSV